MTTLLTHALRTAAAATVLAMAACTPDPTPGPSGSSDGAPGASGTFAAQDAGDATTLRVLAGSEVKDMQPILDEAAKATGVTVKLAYAGTIDGAQQVADGRAAKAYDATWFSSNRYVSLLPNATTNLTSQTKIMSSPVILGVKESKAKALGWDTKAPTWAQISQAVAAKKLTYGMTNPASSNSGFCALVGVATALSGGGTAIDEARITAVTPQLRQFFSGQTLTSGSSGWLADRFKASGNTVDGLINYESVLLDLQKNGGLPEKLTLVYPHDGIVSADYPFSLLRSASAKQESYQKITDYLRTPAVQKQIMERTHRRPVVPDVPLSSEFGTRDLTELPFPAQRSAADGLVAAYLDKIRRPSQMIYVIDTSGSMKGSREDQLRSAFKTLSGQEHGDSTTTFHTRERVTLIPFSTDVTTPTVFDIPATRPQGTLDSISTAVSNLDVDGSTALYSALAAAYDQAQKQVTERPDTFTSIVLMTDGEKTSGIEANEFLSRYQGMPAATKAVPTFTILFGDAKPAELEQIADATKGKVFDARQTPLTQIFRDIRGYQ